MAPLHRSRPQLVALALLVVVCGAAGFAPLLSAPGYEAGLLVGLIGPTLMAWATAFDVAGKAVEPRDALHRGVAAGAVAALVCWVVFFAHGIFSGLCEPLAGSRLFFLGGGAGVVMGGAWGAIAGLVAERFRVRTGAILVSGIVAPLAGAALSLARFYTSPVVFAYDPFFGVFGGPIYDTVVDDGPLLSFRLGSLATLTALFVIAYHLGRTPDGRRLVPVLPGRPGAVVLGVAAAATSLAIAVGGAHLGHWSTAASIQQALGRTLTHERCRIHYSKAIALRDVRLLARECTAHVESIEAYFGVRGPDHYRVYLFASSEEKGRLMGARRTYIAKPWRGEIYIQQNAFPHPVLRHELAHVAAGAMAQGPFLVAGPLGGVVPDPGRIEGVAVAAAPSETSALTLQQWARTLQQLDRLPPLPVIFRLTFLGVSASRAYTVAGAFVSWVHDRFGAQAIRRWYRGATLREATGHDLPDLERRWHADLEKVKVDQRAIEAARLRFERPAIFGRRCPRSVDRLLKEAAARAAAGDWSGARGRYRRVLGLDPKDPTARFGLADCALRVGRHAEARERLAALAADDRLPQLRRDHAVESVADLDLWEGKTDDARRRYRRILPDINTPGRRRAVALKLKATVPGFGDGTDAARQGVVRLLIGDPQLGHNWLDAGVPLGAWDATASDGIAAYLIGRNLFQQRRFRRAATFLRRANERPLPVDDVGWEAARLEVLNACALEDRATGVRALAAFERHRGAAPASIVAAVDAVARRCGFRR